MNNSKCCLLSNTQLYIICKFGCFFFSRNLSSQHFRRNQKAERVWAFLTDAPTEVDFPVLLPMVHDGTCCVTWDRDLMGINVSFTSNLTTATLTRKPRVQTIREANVEFVTACAWSHGKNLKVTTRAGREALMVKAAGVFSSCGWLELREQSEKTSLIAIMQNTWACLWRHVVC